MLRLFGAEIGRHVHIYPTVRVTIPWNIKIGDYSAIGDQVLLYSLGYITLGDRVTISHQAQLCGGTHDYTTPELTLLKPPITVCDGVWICANAFVGPGVRIEKDAIVGACAVVLRDVAAGMIVQGNPAVPLKPRRIKRLDERTPA
jgi:putative colanic acid biosynthesis acetyltransferase WcaF